MLAEFARRRLGVGRRVLEGCGAEVPVRRGRPEHEVRIFDRKTQLTNFGEGGQYPGQFYAMHSIAVDSNGHLYTTETYEGRRVQKFTYKGLVR